MVRDKDRKASTINVAVNGTVRSDKEVVLVVRPGVSSDAAYGESVSEVLVTSCWWCLDEQ